CLRVTEETQIYKKLLRGSNLDHALCSPETLEMLAKFCVATRLKEHENSNVVSKMRVYDGEKLKDTDPKAKTLQEYKDQAGIDEGMTGISTRFAYKTMSETFNYDVNEIACDPVHLMYVLEQAIKREQFPDETEKKYLEFIKAELAPRYAEFIGKEIQKAYLESYGEYGQNLFDRYIAYADAWIEDQDFKDADTGQLLDRAALDNELSKIEKPAGIANPKDFRNEVVKFALRYRAQNEGKNPAWTAYEKIRSVIEKRMFTQVEDLLPVISFESKKDSDTETKHNEFVKRMLARGYTSRQVRRLVEWYMRVNKAGGRGEDGSRLPPPSLAGRDDSFYCMPQFTDRRLNPMGKSLGNRQRFLRRARTQIREAVQKSLKDASVSDLDKNRKIKISTKGT